MSMTSATGNGYTCSCGAWVLYGVTHNCGGWTTPQQYPWAATTWQCPSCRQQVSGFHICNGLPVYMPVAAPEERPESPLAALVADFRALLAKGQSWLAERKL